MRNHRFSRENGIAHKIAYMHLCVWVNCHPKHTDLYKQNCANVQIYASSHMCKMHDSNVTVCVARLWLTTHEYGMSLCVNQHTYTEWSVRGLLNLGP